MHCFFGAPDRRKFDSELTQFSELLIDGRDVFDQSLVFLAPHMSERLLEQLRKLGALIVLEVLQD